MIPLLRIQLDLAGSALHNGNLSSSLDLSFDRRMSMSRDGSSGWITEESDLQAELRGRKKIRALQARVRAKDDGNDLILVLNEFQGNTSKRKGARLIHRAPVNQ